MKNFTLIVAAIAATLAAAQAPPTTLKTPHGLTCKPDASGFIRDWLLLEPIDDTAGLGDNAVQAAVHKEYFPGQFTTTPHDGDHVSFDGATLTWHAVESSKYNVNLFHFGRTLNKKTSNVIFWAFTTVLAPRQMQNVRLAIGSNAASVWWLNGVEVAAIYGDRQTVIDDGVSKRLTLKTGENIIRAAVVNGGGATDFCARFLDADDNPITSLTIALPSKSDRQNENQ